jgi:cytochrome oxidase Cu insertion factor (SCO1/SenC/PrrC family)
MRKTVTTALAVCLLAAVWVSPLMAGQPPQAQAPKPPPAVKVGDTAPDFTLIAFDGQSVTPVSLKDYRGKKNVVLAFYVFAFTGG